MKPLRVSKASERLGVPNVEVPGIPDEIIETFEDEYYLDNPKRAKRDIAHFAVEVANEASENRTTQDPQ